MTPNIISSLRRALLAVGAASALLAGAPSVAQTITLSGATTATCTWSAFTMQPNGSISVTCGTGTVQQPPPDPNIATFTLTGPSSVQINTYPTYKVTRTGGPATEKIAFGYGVTGVGCGWMSQGPFWLDKDQSMDLGVFPIAIGTCLITFGPQEGHNAVPTSKQMSISVTSTDPGPVPGPITNPYTDWSKAIPVVQGCPAAASNARLRVFQWGDVMRVPTLPEMVHLNSGMDSGEVMAIELPASPSGRASVTLTQTQGSATPARPTMDLTVSRCPGVIEENLPQPTCFARTTFQNYHSITAYIRPLPGKPSQSDYFDGCLAPVTQEKYYVNIRWTFASCPLGPRACGFSLQWAEGSY